MLGHLGLDVDCIASLLHSLLRNAIVFTSPFLSLLYYS